MTEIDLSRAEWRKSSYSSQSGNCVEVVRNLPGLVAVRDSKHSEGGTLVVSQETWRAFLRAYTPSSSSIVLSSRQRSTSFGIAIAYWIRPQELREGCP